MCDIIKHRRFQKSYNRSWCSYREKVTKCFEKYNLKFSEQEYKRLYPTGSATTRFYGSAKIHKLKNDRVAQELPIRPIIFNINTASYQFAKYLAKLLSLLSTSEYTVKSTSDFITQTKRENTPSYLKLISFDVTSLFTNFLLDFTIDVILKTNLRRKWSKY